jgi:hypothetical protein
MLARLPILLSSALILAGPSSRPVNAAEVRPRDLYKQALPSIVVLRTESASGGEVGTGFFAVKNGMIVTAAHVVHGASKVTARFADGTEVEVEGWVARDLPHDLVLLSVKSPSRPLLRLQPAEPEIGTHAYAIGAPREFEFSLSDGLISSLRGEPDARLVQFTCPISPGNSGGPLFDEDGAVVGVVSWQFEQGQNLNFAVPSAYVQKLNADAPVQPWSKLDPIREPAGKQVDFKALLRRSLRRLSEALGSGDYGALRTDFAAAKRSALTPEVLQRRYADLARRKTSVTAAVAEALLIETDEESDDTIRLEGFVGRGPNRLRFDVRYTLEEKRWKLTRLQITR